MNHSLYIDKVSYYNMRQFIYIYTDIFLFIEIINNRNG